VWLVLTTTAADGTSVRAFDEGSGPAIVILHAGRDDGSSWAKVAARLASRFRVVRLHRRQYRLDLKPPARPCTIADEIGDVLALAKVIGGPMLLVGHSSGAVVALETLLRSPGTFVGAVLYEPPAVTATTPLGGEALVLARAAVDAGKPGMALRIFLRDIVRIPPWAARLVGVVAAVHPGHRAYVPPQIADCEAVERLGDRLDSYARIETPAVLFGGDRSPAHFGERLDSLARAIPQSERLALKGEGHFANKHAPGQVADLIATLADRVLR
jgi:pimeloyl-ACP methyl ester carboxylesterase